MLLDLVKKIAQLTQITSKGNDVIIKSKDRYASKKEVEKYLIKNKFEYTETFKSSKSSSINVITVSLYKGDIIFKPITVKGAGGLNFEKELLVDLQNTLNDASDANITHKDVISSMNSVLNFDLKNNKYEIIHEGSKNQKRELTFNANKLNVSNSIGSVLTDLTIKTTSKHNVVSKTYLSLKKSKTFYILNASIFKIFLDNSNKTKLCEYFGIDGQKWGGFGDEYRCITKKANYVTVSKNFSDFLSVAYGSDVVIVHKKVDNNVYVKQLKSNAIVTISNLDDDSYIYPEKGVRKYAAIKFKAIIAGTAHIVTFQFRGTTASDVGPKYLRILMERL
jgi:hypothetical protein